MTRGAPFHGGAPHEARIVIAERRESNMLSWAVTFLVIALIAGILGATGVAGAATEIAWILFVVFIILFVVGLVLGRRPPI